MNIFQVIQDLIYQIGGLILGLFGQRDDVKAVQDKVVAMCGYLPTAQSVAAMLAATNPVVTGVVGIATAICEVVSVPLSGMQLISAKVGTVNGVPVEGDWVIKK